MSAANVMVGDSGVHLVDLVGPPGHGTAVYSAPERARGPSPAADVYAVGMLLKKAVADEGAIRLHAWIAPMIAPDPDLRPEAAVAARALERCHPPEPIAALELTPARDIRVRARATQERTLHDADGPRWWWRRLLSAYKIPVSALCAVVIAGALWGVVGGSSAHAQWATPTLDATYGSPEQAAVVLVNRWCQARSLGEYGLLAHVTSPLTPARRADDVWERQLSQGELRMDGFHCTVKSAHEVDSSARSALVTVVLDVSAHTVWKSRSARSHDAAEVTYAVTLGWTSGGWRVSAWD